MQKAKQVLTIIQKTLHICLTKIALQNHKWLRQELSFFLIWSDVLPLHASLRPASQAGPIRNPREGTIRLT